MRRAIRRLSTIRQAGRLCGLGVQLGTGLTGDYELGGIDLDTCRNAATGITEVWAEALVADVNSTTEISPSETGYKIYFLYEARLRSEFLHALGAKGQAIGRSWKKAGGAHPPGIEVYLGGRYFAYTGQFEPGLPTDLRVLQPDDLRRVADHHGPRLSGSDVAVSRVPTASHSRPGGRDNSRSARAFRLALEVRAADGDERTFRSRLDEDGDLADWAIDERQVLRAWTNSEGASLLRTKSGEPKSNMANAMALLRTQSELRSVFRYDEMQRTTVLTRNLPDAAGGDRRELSRPTSITDHEITLATAHLQRLGLTSLSHDTARRAVEAVARDETFHPVRDYLARLRWDGIERLGHWLPRYLGAPDSDYTRAIGRHTLVGMIARVEQPGCKLDYMMILEGAQGARKSTVCRILGGEWYSDHLPELGSGKETAQHLRGKWLIEIPELQALGKADTNLLKAFITRSVEKYRPPYERLEVEEPRQCILIGTTNNGTYLKDVTGARRFWPVRVGDLINTDGLQADRDQLLAEAHAAYRAGEKWHPSPEFEREHMLLEQRERLEHTEWEAEIAKFLRERDEHGEPKLSVTLTEVASGALDMPKGRLFGPTEKAVVEAMRRCGWRPGRGKRGARIWERDL